MSILRIPILFVGSKGEKHLNALFDSGADLSWIHPDCVKERVSLDFVFDDILLGRLQLV